MSFIQEAGTGSGNRAEPGRAGQFAHFLNKHGPNGTVDHSLGNVNDIARMGFFLDNYDNVEVVQYTSGDTDYSREFRETIQHQC